MMKIAILDGYTVSRDDLNWGALTAFGELGFFARSRPDEVLSHIGDASAVLTSKCLIDRSVMEACPNLRYIGVIATGYNNIDISCARERGIAVTNIPAYSTASVAQFTFALLLEVANAVGRHAEAVKGGVWARCPDFCFTLTEQMELAGKTMGIIGYGSIGRQVAQIACAIGMRVVVYTPHPPESETAAPENDGFSGNGDSRPIRFVPLETLISSSDVISLHCRMTEENKGFINRETIAHMKDGVIILNTARGPLIDEFDLAVALQTGKVRAAGIDVLAEEPPDRKNLLVSMENCIVTPHNAWITKESRARLIDIQYLNLEAFLNGDRLNRIV